MHCRQATHTLILAFAVGITADMATAAQIEIDVSSRETYVGVSVDVQLSLINARNATPPEFPKIPDALVQGGGRPSTQTQFLNGVTTTRHTYTYRITPREKGKLIIPAISVEVDGETHTTQPIEILVTEGQSNDLVFVDLKDYEPSLYIGEELTTKLQIWILPFIHRENGRSMKLSASDMWSCIDLENSKFGIYERPLGELLSQRTVPQGREMLRQDSTGEEHAFYLYELEPQPWPERTGPINFSEIQIVVRYPVHLTRSRSFFQSGLRIDRQQMITGRVDAQPIMVKPIPTEDRPPYFSGAVGRYTIQAAAKPTEVAVGDPITLTLIISGAGRFDTLPAPPLAEIAELNRMFKIPSDPLAGEVAGRRKRFTQTIRAQSADVAAIPPIPFVFFDPDQEKFITAYSQPIPITVEAAETLSVSQIVESRSGNSQAVRHLTELDSGIFANYTGAEEILSQQAFTPGWGTAVAGVLPPVLYGVCWFVRRRDMRLKTDTHFARRRSARRHALKRLSSARGNASDVATALCGYVADRCNLPAGGLTRTEAIEQLRRHDVPEPLVQQADDLLQRCEAFQYAGAEINTNELIESATQCVTQLERQRF